MSSFWNWLLFYVQVPLALLMFLVPDSYVYIVYYACISALDTNTLHKTQRLLVVCTHQIQAQQSLLDSAISYIKQSNQIHEQPDTDSHH